MCSETRRGPQDQAKERTGASTARTYLSIGLALATDRRTEQEHGIIARADRSIGHSWGFHIMQGIGIAPDLLLDDVKKRLGEDGVAMRFRPSRFAGRIASQNQVSEAPEIGIAGQASYKMEAWMGRVPLHTASK